MTDDVTALRDALLEEFPYSRFDPEYGEIERMVDALIAAAKAEALDNHAVPGTIPEMGQITPERLHDALVNDPRSCEHPKAMRPQCERILAALAADVGSPVPTSNESAGAVAAEKAAR